jgi:MFS family permease
MFDWYRSLDPTGRRTFWACFGGFGLDALDVQIYSFLVPALTALWSITATQAGLLATSTLLLSAFGGWIAGVLADRIGRVRVLQVTIVWFAIFTFLSGLTGSFDQLLVTRGLQGLGFGGEWAAGSVLMGEVIAARYRGRAVGIVQSSWALGWGLAAIVATVLLTVLPPWLAWRCVFFAGILPALSVFWVRRFVPEPEAYAQIARAREPGVLAIFGPALAWTTARACLLTLGAQSGYYTITTWLPTFLRSERHLTVIGSSLYLAVVIAGSFAGYVSSAYLCDAVGRRYNFVSFAVGSGLIAILYTRVAVSDHVMLVLGFPLGFCASGIFSCMGPILTELFPTELRATGQGFCYNFGRGFAAICPAIVGGASGRWGLGATIGVLAASAYGLVVLAALSLPETRGLELSPPRKVATRAD